MVIAALFTTAKSWKQPKCPLTDEQIRKMRFIYTIEHYSAIKKNEIMPFTATWMDLDIFKKCFFLYYLHIWLHWVLVAAHGIFP